MDKLRGQIIELLNQTEDMSVLFVVYEILKRLV